MEKEIIEMPCLECGKMKIATKLEAEGVFNVFCPGGDCEDKYAWKQ